MKLVLASLLAVIAAGCTDPGAGAITSATITRTGGLTPMPPPGSTCTPLDERYTYDGPTHALDWQRCETPSDGSPDHVASGRVALTAGTAAQLEDALTHLHDGAQPCGGDLVDRIVIVSPDGTRVYDPAQCAVGEDAVFEILASVVP